MFTDLMPFVERVNYDHETGGLFSKRYGTRYSAKDKNGYIRISIGSKSIGAHRLVWACHYGENPSGEVDHINGVRDDNRICNLRVVSRSENMQNAKTPITNSSGYHGVSLCSTSLKWTAQIWSDGKRYRLGSFDDPEEAHKEYLRAKSNLHKLSPEIKNGKLVHARNPEKSDVL